MTQLGMKHAQTCHVDIPKEYGIIEEDCIITSKWGSTAQQLSTGETLYSFMHCT